MKSLGLTIALLVVPLRAGAAPSGEASPAAAQDPAPESDAQAPLPHLVLHLLPGAPAGRSLVILRLFSQEHQEAMEARARARFRGEPLPPLPAVRTLQATEHTWTEHLALVARDGDWRLAPSSAFEPFEPPPTGALSFGTSQRYQARFLVRETATLPPGTAIQAELTLEGETLLSNAISVPDPPEGPFEGALRQAAVELRLRDFEALLPLARTLVEQRPEAMEGYYHLGLALEGLGDPERALRAYQMALDRLPAGDPSAMSASPALLRRRIRAVEKALGD